MNSSANQALQLQILQLKQEHPYWGYRHIWAYPKYHEKFPDSPQNADTERVIRTIKED